MYESTVIASALLAVKLCIIDRDKKNNEVVLCNASLVHVGKHSFLLKELCIMKTAEVH